MKRKCHHRTALLIRRFPRAGLDYLKCTCGCGQPFWMLADPPPAHEIPAAAAVRRILVSAGKHHVRRAP